MEQRKIWNDMSGNLIFEQEVGVLECEWLGFWRDVYVAVRLAGGGDCTWGVRSRFCVYDLKHFTLFTFLPQ